MEYLDDIILELELDNSNKQIFSNENITQYVCNESINNYFQYLILHYFLIIKLYNHNRRSQQYNMKSNPPYLCMYACMYVRTYVCMYVCMYVSIYCTVLHRTVLYRAVPDDIIPAGELSPALKMSNTNCPLASSNITEDLGSFIIALALIILNATNCLNAA